MATSTNHRRCKISVLVVIICLLSITVLTGDWITRLMKKFLMTWNLLRNILLRRMLLWLTWSSSLAQHVAIDTWNCCWKHMLHWSLVSSRLNLASRHSARAKRVRVRCNLFGLLWEKRHHLIHFFIVNYWLLWLVCLIIRILIVTSRCTVIGKLGFICSTYSSNWFNVNPNLFAK
jgi:hypothetical protein